MHGLASAGCSGGGGGGEMDSLYQVREDVADECFKSNTDDLVGFKVRESPPPSTSFFVNSRTLMGSRGFHNGIRSTPSVSSRIGSKLPLLLLC